MVDVSSNPVDAAGMIEAYLSRAAAAEAALAALLAPFDLGVGEWRVLRRLHDGGPASPGVVADALVLTPGGITRIAGRLAARRLLVRAGSGGADARRRTLALTGTGVALVRQVAPVVDAVDWGRILGAR